MSQALRSTNEATRAIVPPGGWLLAVNRPPMKWAITWNHSLCLDHIGNHNVRDYLEERPGMGGMSMDQIISFFIRRHQMDFRAWGWSAEKYQDHLVRFFTWAKVRMIVLAAQQGRVGDLVRSDLETHLTRVCPGMDSADWCRGPGWLKTRILQCFDDHELPVERRSLLLNYRIPLDEILKLPIREAE